MRKIRRALIALLGFAVLGAGQEKAPPINLLKLLDPAKDSVEGTWRLAEGKLQTPGQPFARIEIPYAPPPEYDLKIVLEKVALTGSFTLGLAREDAQFSVVLDGVIEGKTRTGLDLVEGNPFYANETTYTGGLFAEKKKSTLLVSVRAGQITVTVDGKKVIDWKADYERLTLYPGWRVPRKTSLFVGSWTAIFRFEQVELQPVTGAGRSLR